MSVTGGVLGAAEKKMLTGVTGMRKTKGKRTAQPMAAMPGGGGGAGGEREVEAALPTPQWAVSLLVLLGRIRSPPHLIKQTNTSTAFAF